MRFGNFAKDTACFDAAAFKMADAEALALDPQARIALEQTQVKRACFSFRHSKMFGLTRKILHVPESFRYKLAQYVKTCILGSGLMPGFTSYRS